MTEDEARADVTRIVGGDATSRLDRLAALIIAENGRQNLIARSTVASIWSRHILDSIQLLQWAAGGNGIWVDIGTGGGFPGLAIAIVSPRPMLLLEPRRQRASFLTAMAEEFGLTNTQIVQARVDRVERVVAAVISARAVASIADLYAGAIHCATLNTRWLLPRGAGWQSDLSLAKAEWKGMFHVEQSLSDPSAKIVVATKVARR